VGGPGGLGWVICHGTALAAPPLPAPAEDGVGASNSFALPYALVIMCVVLGMLVVLRPSGRRERETPEEYRSKEMLSGQ
jgi:hypothetical protein